MEENKTNLFINIALVIGLVILVICQGTFFSLNLQKRTQVATQRKNELAAFNSDKLTLVFAPPACDVVDLSRAVFSVRSAIVNIDTPANRPPGGSGRQASGLKFDIPSADSLKTDFETLGSGIVVDSQGYVLTCYHLISGVSDIMVTIFSAGKKSYPAEIVKTDINNDLAILKIELQEPLLVAKLGNSEMIKVADTVLSIGSPFGLEHTVTAGIISDDERDLTINGYSYGKLIQTDTAINRGSAGGALINTKGEVIGINMAIYAPSGVFNGLAFAIPMNRARPLLNEAITHY